MTGGGGTRASRNPGIDPWSPWRQPASLEPQSRLRAPGGMVLRKIRGLLYCILWYLSILAGYIAFFCPLSPLLLVSNKLYRRLTDIVFNAWQLYPAALLDLVADCKLVVTGDELLNPRGSCLLVMNHRTRTDWNFFWVALHHARPSPAWHEVLLGPPMKFVMKDSIRHVPAAGWVLQMSCCALVRRSWPQDEPRLRKYLQYLADIGYRWGLLLFPEGTDLTPATRTASDSFALKAGLQPYHHVLHPRTTGFDFLARTMPRLEAVYDVTIHYPDQVPQREADLALGAFPRVVRLHLSRHEVPEEAGPFLADRWREKEAQLAKGRLPPAPRLWREDRRPLYAALVFWTLLPWLVLWVLRDWQAFRWYVAVHTALLAAGSGRFGGHQGFEVAVYNFKKRFFRNPW